MNPKKLMQLLSTARSISGLATNSSESEKSSSGEPEKWLEPKDARNWALVKIGHEGMMLDKIQKQNKIVEDTVKAQQRAAGYKTSEDDEDMGVSIGNENHYHGRQSQLPMILAAMTGGMIPAAALAGYLWAKQPENPNVDTDTNTTYDVEKWIPDSTPVTRGATE